VDSLELLDEAMNTIKQKGFINYYGIILLFAFSFSYLVDILSGMQRFGTASVPTHSIGLALLKSEWQKAVDMILQKRHGEHPEVEAARDAWLVEGDLEKALNLFPRRVIAERCILESFKKQKGDTRNVMGALSTASAISISIVAQRMIKLFITDPTKFASHVHSRVSIICLECHCF
jgi:tRNA pseudouridine13 synthase